MNIRKNFVMIFGAVVLITLGIAAQRGVFNAPDNGAVTTSTPEIVGAGEHCGGFILNAPTCASGFRCQLNVSNPDTGGICVPDESTSTPAGILPYDSGIRGTVMLGPTCPVERIPPDPNCAPKPYQTLVVVFRASDATHALAFGRSDANGNFSFSLPPGDYTLGAGESNLPRCGHPAVTVEPNGYASATIFCDTGIR